MDGSKACDIGCPSAASDVVIADIPMTIIGLDAEIGGTFEVISMPSPTGRNTTKSPSSGDEPPYSPAERDDEIIRATAPHRSELVVHYQGQQVQSLYEGNIDTLTGHTQEQVVAQLDQLLECFAFDPEKRLFAN